MSATPTSPRVRHKSFTFHTRLSWHEERRGQLHAANKPTVVVGSPPEFKGDPRDWSPEELFVGAVETCTMTTFVAFATRKHLPLVAYSSEAEGTLEFEDENYRFTRIVIRPTVRVETVEAVDQARQILRDAHHACMIGNSIRAEVLLEPTFESEDTAP